MSELYQIEKLKEAVLWNTQEVLPGDAEQLEKELQFLVEQANASGERIRHYIGFEISGQIHIGTGIAAALKIKRLQDAGVKCSIWLADYHTFLNNKLDGTFESIRRVAKDYFGPIMLKCCEIVGCDINDVEILYAEEVYNQTRKGQSFWTYDMKVAKHLTLNRILKSVSIMGKEAGDNVEFSTLRYPAMQVADAFFMQTHLVHAGLDQRKCHVLMREVAPKLDDSTALTINGKKVKPVAIHHSLLLGLEKPTSEASDEEGKSQVREVAKMSKSKPDSAIWVTDSAEEISRKLKKAYCPMPQPNQSHEEMIAEQEWNPMLDWCKKMIFPGGQKLTIERKPEWGGNMEFNTYQELEEAYFSGNLHPMDLKNGVASTLATWFSPIREWVEQNPDGLEFLKSVKK
ncbi:MAG: tyrosine--tRNA ligase [Patescibacteria group bacterium]